MNKHTDAGHSMEELFQRFLRLDALGMRREAKQVVRELVDAVSDISAKDAWTNANLHRLPKNKASRVQHELFRHIVFPSLKAAFDRGEAEASYLLGKHAQNLYSDRVLFDQVGQRSAEIFFRKAFHADPDSVLYRDAYLGSLMNALQYLFHEWPSGILIPPEDWQNGIDGVRKDLSQARLLDQNNKYSAKLAEWLQYTSEYEKRLSERLRHQ